MSYYRECEYCGAHLDPGERCDCGEGGLDWADGPMPPPRNKPTAMLQALQKAYLAHLIRPGSHRLPWMECLMDELRDR